jgi:hypothetical protein
MPVGNWMPHKNINRICDVFFILYVLLKIKVGDLVAV